MSDYSSGDDQTLGDAYPTLVNVTAMVGDLGWSNPDGLDGFDETENSLAQPWIDLLKLIGQTVPALPVEALNTEEVNSYRRDLSRAVQTLSSLSGPNALSTRVSVQSIAQNWIPLIHSRVFREDEASEKWTQVQVEYAVVRRLADQSQIVTQALSQLREDASQTRNSAQATLQRAELAAKQATEAATRAEGVAKEAARAAGEIGAGEMAGKFVEYSGEQLKAASRYRNATIIILGVALIVAVAFTVGWDRIIPSVRDAPGSEWSHAVYRIAVLAALTGLAAYLGRQAGNHRRLGDWAAAIAVQLKDFRAFVAELPEAPKEQALINFSRRVLGSPPEGKASTEASNLMQTALEAVVKRPV